MGTRKLGTQYRGRLVRGLLLVCLPLLMGQEDCSPNPDPKTTANPVAFDCVLAGQQVFIPIDLTVALDRYPTAGTGMMADVSVVAHIPAEVFCAAAAVPVTQLDLASATLVTEFGNVMPPGTLSANFSAINLPYASIDIADACAGVYGPAIDVDFGTIPTTPWADGAWTVDFMVTSAVRFWLANVVPATPVIFDLLALCDPTDKSNPPNGTTNDPEDSPRISADRDGDGDYEALANATDQVQFNVNGFCVGYRCDDFNDCTVDTCDVQVRWCFYDNEPDGISCDRAGEPGLCNAGTCVECVDVSQCAPAGECSEPTACTGNACVLGNPLPFGTTCSAGACDGGGVCLSSPQPPCGVQDPSYATCTKLVSLACTNNVIDVVMVDVELTVSPDPLIGGTTVPVHYSGVFEFSELFLDAAQGGIPGGVTAANLIDAQATVHVRSGATATDVTLSGPVLPGTCLIPPATCDPANDGPSVPGARSNTDCVPTGTFNPCQHIVALPMSTDCAPGGTCESLGKIVQCQVNGFCITGDLPIPLTGVASSMIVDPSGVVSFGWDDQSTGATLNPDGTWNLPLSAFTDPLGPNGVKINIGGLALALQCTMAVPSDGPLGPVPPVPDQSSPTPDYQLLQFPIQVP
jgi:hypothetical protein